MKSISAVFTCIFGPNYRQSMYGKRIKKSKFILDDKITLTNHGSYIWYCSKEGVRSSMAVAGTGYVNSGQDSSLAF